MKNKVKNLKAGEIYKNYKELCAKLEVEPLKSGSNSYKAQIKEFQRYFEFEKEGQKLIITKVYRKEREKVDKREKGNYIVHSDNIEYMMLTLLSKFDIKKSERVGFSKNFLFSYTGLSNENFKLAKGNRLKFSQLIDMPVQEINECFDYTNNRMLQALQRTFNSMKRKALITWGNGYNMVMLDEEGERYLEIASAEAEKVILEIERKVLGKHKYNSKRYVFLYGNWTRFKADVEKDLKKIYPNLVYYYDCIYFNYNKTDIDKAMKQYKKQGSTQASAKDKVNDNFSKSLDGTITRKNKTTKESLGSKDKVTIFDLYRGSDEYVDSQKLIKNKIVNRKAEKLKLPNNIDKDKCTKKQREFFNKYETNDESEQLLFTFESDSVPF